MKLTKLCYVAAAVLAAGLVYNASAWPDYRWTGLGGDNMWNNPLNWTNLTTFNVDLPEDEASTLGAVQVDQANGSTNCIIPAGYTVDLNSANPGAPLYNTLFGPEFGMHLSIYGTLKYNWMMAPVQNNPARAVRTIINMYTNSVLYTAGAGIGIGDAWWWYTAAPFVTLNMYGNAQLNVPNIALGGHLNIYDKAVATATAAVFTGNGGVSSNQFLSSGACSDPTASLVLGGGTLILPTGWTNEATEPGTTVFDLAERGVLRAYGKLQDTNDLVVTDTGSNTIVTTVPLGGSLQRIYMAPLCQSTMPVGAFQQVVVSGDYPSVSGVLLSSAEPGVDPASLPGTISYTSSNPNVATVDSSGIVRAIAPGTATLSATLGTFTSTNTLTVTVGSVPATLVHRYSFNESAGSTTAADSVGGSAWNGTLEGTGTAFSGSGSVVLTGATNNVVLGDGVASYVSLPPGIVSNMSEITIETWATIDATTNNNFENLFAFGNTDTDPFSSSEGEGGYYITFSPHTGGGTASLNFGQGLPGNAAEVDAVNGSVLDGQTNIQIVGVYSPDTGTESLYTNGVLAASTTLLWNAMTDPVAFNGPAINRHSILSMTLGADPINYLGESLYAADPGFKGSINEFRIYNGALTASQIVADHALGPNQLLGTNTKNVPLSATQSGKTLEFSWPTSSALVTLESSPTLGPSATWTPVAMPAAALTASGGNYHFQTTMSGTAQYYRLSE